MPAFYEPTFLMSSSSSILHLNEMADVEGLKKVFLSQGDDEGAGH